MEYKIKELDSQDRKNIYLLLLLFSSPGIIILLTYLYIAVSWNSRGIFINSLPIVLAAIIIPHIFSIRYLVALKNNEKYVIKGILTYAQRSYKGNCWYTINEKDTLNTAAIGDIFCDKVEGGNIVELHILPFMYSKKKVFYAKIINESYEKTVKVLDIAADKTGYFINITFYNFGKYSFLKSAFLDSVKVGDTLLAKVTTDIKSGKPLFKFEKIDNSQQQEVYRF